MREGESAFEKKIGLLVILLLILCGMLLAGTNKGYHKDVYSEHYVPVEEVQDELSFLYIRRWTGSRYCYRNRSI